MAVSTARKKEEGRKVHGMHVYMVCVYACMCVYVCGGREGGREKRKGEGGRERGVYVCMHVGEWEGGREMSERCVYVRVYV